LVPEHALPTWNFDFLCDGLRQFFLLSDMKCIEPHSQVCRRFLGVFDLRNTGQNKLPLSEIELEASRSNAHNVAVELANVCQIVQRVTRPICFEVIIIEPEDSPPPIRTRGYR